MRNSAADRETAVRGAFAEQARWCTRLNSPLTARLCTLLGLRLDRESAVGRRLLDWPGDPGSDADAVALRLCGGLHFLVRSGAAPRLAACYPPNPLPDEAKPEHKREGGAERQHTEEQLDRGLEQTFPASDPVSIQSDR